MRPPLDDEGLCRWSCAREPTHRGWTRVTGAPRRWVCPYCAATVKLEAADGARCLVCGATDGLRRAMSPSGGIERYCPRHDPLPRHEVQTL